MADLLTHVLVVYVCLTVAGWRVAWLSPRWIAVAMAGAVVPDLSRLALVADPATIAAVTGIPFTFGVFETLGGVLLVAGIGILAFERRWWPRVYGLLVVGGVSHLLLDGLKVWIDGRSSLWLFPILPTWRPPTPSLYVSSDPLVPTAAVASALVVFGIDRWRSRQVATNDVSGTRTE